jgi:hypothetical protein
VIDEAHNVFAAEPPTFCGHVTCSSLAPASLMARATTFRMGEALVASRIVPHPALIRFGARIGRERRPCVTAEADLRRKSIRIARIDGAVSGTPFLVALVVGLGFAGRR